MSRAFHENRIIVVASPKELRDLADLMEKRWAESRTQGSALVGLLHQGTGDISDPTICLYVDYNYFHWLEAEKRKNQPIATKTIGEHLAE